MTGTTIAQAIPIAISPILTRIYSPEDFGVFALYMSIVGTFAAMATLRYDTAIMLPKKDKDAINIVLLSVMISFFISLIVLLIIFLFNQQITNLLETPDISNWLYVVPLTVLLTGLYQSFNFWNNRKKEYHSLSISKITQSVATGSINLGMGFVGFGVTGLIVGSLIGQVVSTSLLAKMALNKDNKLLVYVNRLKIFAFVKKYKKLPLLNLPNALIDSFRLSGISILIAKFFTAATLGQFALAWKMVQVPMTLVGGSLSQVFFQKVASSNKVNLHTIVKKFIVRASLAAAPMFLIVYFFSVDIFIFVFGENWKLAGESASVMAPWLFINFISSPLSTLFIVLNRQEVMLMFSIVFMAVPLAIIFIFKNSSFIDVLSMVTFSMTMMLILFVGMVLHYTKQLKGVE